MAGVPTSAANSDRLRRLEKRLAALDEERASISAEIELLRAADELADSDPPSAACEARVGAGEHVDRQSPAPSKIGLFRRLFRGRPDVFPLRWENSKTGRSGYSPACANEWRRGVCEKPRVKCSACLHQAFIGVDDTTIERHLRGAALDGSPFVMGVYPLLPDNTCWFLAADFDEGEWRRDVSAFSESCRRNQVSVAIERSRSGNGAHAWIFFANAVPAALARRLGAFLISQTMERLPDIGFKSYDRFFPSQDTMPSGGFGNLIALPLQGRARLAGNSAFIDEANSPYPDQWAFLASVDLMSRDRVDELVGEASASGKILPVRIPLVDDDEEPWLAPPSRRRPPPAIEGQLPPSIDIVHADQIYIAREGLPPALVTRLLRIAAFQNPEFYAAQAMRRPTFATPRIIACAELTSHHIALPRGCLDAALELLASLRIAVRVEDRRFKGPRISPSFIGKLRPEQELAVSALQPHDCGVLAATTAYGKTVIGIRMIAERGLKTLILVHRRILLDQWIERLTQFSDIPREAIGAVGAGKRKLQGIVDIALIQSLVRKGEVDDIVAEYGHVIVDECHHLSAVSFELVARRLKARYVLGLSATVTRKDGHHPIIAMQCGPIRYRADPRSEAAKRPFSHTVMIRNTNFAVPAATLDARPPIQDIFRAVAIDAARNDLIFDDVLRALEAKRSPVIITERTNHLEYLEARLKGFAKNVIVLRGGQTDRQRRDIADRLLSIPDDEERVLLATGRYLGEGFDDPRLDTLFLTMPIAWKGTLAQYAGRLHRLHDAKREVLIYDYVDQNVPVLARMASKRRKAYQSIGYRISALDELGVGDQTIWGNRGQPNSAQNSHAAAREMTGIPSERKHV